MLVRQQAAQTPVNATANGPNAKKQKQSKAAAPVTAAKPAAHVSAAKAVVPTTAVDAAPATKKKKKKAKKKSAGDDAPAPAKPVAAPSKSQGSEIDDLFASLKTKKREQIEAEAQQQRAAKKALAKEWQAKKLLDEQIKLLEAQSAS